MSDYEARSADCLREVIKQIDTAFGDGYAKSNPALVGKLVAASIQATSIQILAESVRTLIESIQLAQIGRNF
jgi:hypothetical protein